MTTPDSIVFLVDVDNTLLDNDRIQDDIKQRLEREFGADCRDRYWTLQEKLFAELGYRDYLGALNRHRVEHPQEDPLMSMGSYLIDYPFADRLFPGALGVLERFRAWGRPGSLTDGEYYRFQILGMDVYDTEGAHLGSIAEVLDVDREVRRYLAA